MAALVLWHYFGRLAKLIVIALGFAALYVAIHPSSSGAIAAWCGQWLSGRSCTGVAAAVGWSDHPFDAILRWMATVHG